MDRLKIALEDPFSVKVMMHVLAENYEKDL